MMIVEQTKLASNQNFILLLIAAGLVVYANTLANGLFWDDNDFILNNAYIKDWQYFGKYFSENVIAGAGLLSNYWRPILLTVFSLEWHLFQDWALGYHLVNTAFHIADGVLLFFILVRIFDLSRSAFGRTTLPRPGEGSGERWLAFLTALVFLIHPLQTEAVSYANSLGDSLSVFFMFTGILLYQKKRYWSTGLMYALALMSKETAVIMPGLLVLTDVIARREIWKIIKRTWPYLAGTAVYILLRATSLNFLNTFNIYNEQNIFTESPWVRLLTFFRILTVYFGLMFRPWTLHMERSVPISTGLASWDVILGAVLALGLLFLAFYSSKRWPVLSFGIFWFFIGLAPTSNLAVPINGLLYEHWLYLPLIGIFLIAVWLGMRVAQKFARPRRTKILLILLIGYLAFFAARSISRNREWHDPITFYTQTLKHAPQSYRVINNLGMAYADSGNLELAIHSYSQAIALDSRAPVAYHNLGNALKVVGRIDEAILNFEKAIALDSKFVYSYSALIKIYLEQQDEQKAREILEKYERQIGSD